MLKSQIIMPFVTYFELPSEIEAVVIMMLTFISTYYFVKIISKGVKKWYKFLKIS